MKRKWNDERSLKEEVETVDDNVLIFFYKFRSSLYSVLYYTNLHGVEHSPLFQRRITTLSIRSTCGYTISSTSLRETKNKLRSVSDTKPRHYLRRMAKANIIQKRQTRDEEKINIFFYK